eukprot:scaffold80554_cov61-Phaeocystis_antarctica.AAC.3
MNPPQPSLWRTRRADLGVGRGHGGGGKLRGQAFSSMGLAAGSSAWLLWSSAVAWRGSEGESGEARGAGGGGVASLWRCRVGGGGGGGAGGAATHGGGTSDSAGGGAGSGVGGGDEGGLWRIS